MIEEKEKQQDEWTGELAQQVEDYYINMCEMQLELL